MSPIPTAETSIFIQGPFWKAKALVLEGNLPGANAEQARHLRTLFVEAHPSSNALVHYPGTVLALVCAVEVDIAAMGLATCHWTRDEGNLPPLETENQIRDALLRDLPAVSLLLLQAPPAAVAAGRATWTCLAGEIALGAAPALEPLWQACGLSGVAGCLAHGSGLSVHGSVAVPWEQGPGLAGWYMLSVDLPHPAQGDDAFRLAPEPDRMSAAEIRNFQSVWNRLSRTINPRHPRNGAVAGAVAGAPTWVTFELTDPTAAPSLYWQLGGPDGPAIHPGPGEVAILLSDQPPYGAAGSPQPASLAQVVPDDVAIKATPAGLEITARAGAPGARTLQFSWRRAGPAKPSELCEASELLVAFDPVQAPALVRSLQGLPPPSLRAADDGNTAPRLEPPLVWGFMPLEDGWAQLPFPNLTEQVFVELAKNAAPGDGNPPASVLQGAVSFGNDDPAVLNSFPSEQPWNLALVGARGVKGTWELAPDATGQVGLSSVELSVYDPVVYLNGLVWLATARPTAEDALPDLARWTTALAPLTLRTVDDAAGVFPPLVRLRLTGLGLTMRAAQPAAPSGPARASAGLDKVTLAFEVDRDRLAELAGGRPPILPADLFARHLPLIWRRHPTVPMIQALPLTQNRLAANYPAASRQLMPFALPVTGDDLPVPTAAWRFRLDGAHAWPRLDGEPTVSPDWLAAGGDLPVAALSLPGLEFVPVEPGQGWPPQLAAQLRFDLPYLDQVQALAQLPPEPAAVDAPETGPAPLARETLLPFWRTLAERAALARAAAVEALDRPLPLDGLTGATGNGEIRTLVEPLAWSVRAALDLSAYPGALALANLVGSEETLALSAEDALRGVEGTFIPDGGTLRRTAGDGGEKVFQVVAGSMAAHSDPTQGYRDQRGLFRRASVAGPDLVRTPVALQAPETLACYELASLLRPLGLWAGGAEWGRFWFRDLPLKQRDQTFIRAETRSPEAVAKDTDINDPDALAHEWNFLAGYQWGLAPLDGAPVAPGDAVRPLALGALHFFPLTLESVALAGDEVARLELAGRLQLPLPGGPELADLGNAVRLSFTRKDGRLALSGAALLGDAGRGEWPLELSGGELSDAPLLTWTGLSLQDGRVLAVEGAALEFVLFDTPWRVALGPLAFGLDSAAGPEIDRTFAAIPGAALQPAAFNLRLAPAGDPAHHACSVVLHVGLGARRPDAGESASLAPAAFETAITFNLVGDRRPIWGLARLFRDLAIAVPPAGPDAPSLYQANTLRFSWQTCSPHGPDAATPEILPGMPLALDAGREIAVPGFAVLSFTIQPGDPPRFELQAGYMEALLTARWGEFLPDPLPGQPLPLSEAQAFGASAGQLTVAYTSAYARPRDAAAPSAEWQETFLLDGFVEIKNLVSWPAGIVCPPDANTLQLPPSTGGDLTHLRHLVRILFNQHTLPNAVPVFGRGLVLFDLGAEPWQFPAVVEHRLAQVAVTNRTPALANERRWTAVQEVRICTPAQLAKAIRVAGDFRAQAGAAPGAPDNGLTLPTLGPVADLNQVVCIDRAGKPYVELSEAGIWLGSSNPAPDAPPRHCYRVLRFHVKGVPRGARVDRATLSLTPTGATEQKVPIRLRVHVANSVRADPLDATHPVDPQQLVPYPDDVEIAEAWTFPKPFALLDNLKSLLQVLVNRADWTPDGAFVTVVVEGIPAPPQGYVPQKRNATAAQLALTVRPATFAEPLVAGLFAPDLQPLLRPELEALGSTSMLFVEASAPFWLRDRPLTGGAPDGAPALTAIRFLPTGVLLAELSSPADYGATAGQTWQLLVMPFLGRLQPEPVPPAGSPLRVDPVLLLAGAGPGSPAPGSPAQRSLALVLANRGDSAPVVFDVSGFDGLTARAITRLDRATLEENWLRLQWLPQQAAAGPGIMAGLPNSPGRLSRDAALRRMLDAVRHSYPPTLPPAGYAPPPPAHGDALIWRQAALLLLEGVARPHDDAVGRPYAWRLAALSLARLASPGDGGLLRYPAVTILPAWSVANDPLAGALPVGFAVSPYLALDYRPRTGPAAETPALRVDELLALDPAAGAASAVLRTVATLALDAAGNAVTRDFRSEPVERWALETARRLAPQSPVLVLRTRSIDRDAGWPTTDYAFRVLNPQRAEAALARRTVRLRTAVRGLHFRQGQFNPAAMPPAVQPFEVAPPQATGLQPLYLTAAPALDAAAGDGPGGAAAHAWPWGLSALRAAIRYTGDEQGVAGEPVPAGGSTGVLWWQSVQAGVQYRAASHESRPAASLPRLFRSRPIPALLPVNPQAPLPDVTAAVAAGAAGPAWQPILPGRLRYLLTGSRPGVPLVLRHMLLRQDGPASPRPSVVSGSVPIQHRSPRPVPLPPNRPGGQDLALQTWAGCFEPGATGIFAGSPVAETLTAPAAVPAYGARIVLVEPRHGRTDADWTGLVTFTLTPFGPGSPASGWTPECALVGDGVILPMTAVQTGDTWTAVLDPKDAARLADLLPRIRGLAVRLTPVPGGDGRAAQSATLPLTYAPAGLRLPLAPVFVHFEDPEYNRRLGSAAASAEALLVAPLAPSGEAGPNRLQLSADRTAYDPQSEIAFRYDWTGPAAVLRPDAVSITLAHTGPGGVTNILAEWPSPADGNVPPAGAVCLATLPRLAARKPVTLHAGDRLAIRLAFDWGSGLVTHTLEVDVVDIPAVPAPEAGYALLRRHDGVVEAARFGWNPPAARVELVCPDDLRTGFVRRRAIFEWQDTVRAGRVVTYAIQKITEGGSTHCPPEAAFRPVLGG